MGSSISYTPLDENFESTSIMYSTVREMVPKVCIIGGKAAAFYALLRHIFRLIMSVRLVVSSEQDVGDLLKVIFLPNYNFSLAEVVIAANDLSEHTSTVGMEASGTFSMKFLMNGTLSI